MLVANFTTQVPTMGNTRTYEDFYKFLGVKPARLGIVANLYPQNTAEYLTTSLKNVKSYKDQFCNQQILHP